ncbi:DUF1902 domain-containing protein [Chroococcidiopsis sp. CCMEE 29]|uniref:DUF1902 domain-containing protein n=1 Tax=Chroococcidiopsis sp. CCMEE 29 TaxID=155894 RepID=UPI0031F89135
MTQTTFKIQSFWDAEAQVWLATSDDIPGLVTEASTLESLTQKLREIIPELIRSGIHSGLTPKLQ